MTEVNIEDIKKDIELNESLQRLFKNRDFKHVILETYLKTYALQLVQLSSGQAAIRDDSLMKLFQARLNATGSLQQWFDSVVAAGENAKEVLNRMEQGE